MRYIKCRGCGRELSADVKFCKYCGTPVEPYAGPEYIQCPVCGSQVGPGHSFCTICGAPLGQNGPGYFYPPEQENKAEPEPTPPKHNHTVALVVVIVLLVVVALVAAFVAVHTITDQEPSESTSDEIVSDETTSREDQEPSVSNNIIVTHQKDGKSGEDRKEDKDREKDKDKDKNIFGTITINRDDKDKTKDTSDSDSKPNADALPAVQNTVDNYLDAFIQDVNAGRYNAMYSYVESGSEVEESQKRFIDNSKAYEDLVGAEFLSYEQTGDDIYHITVLEEYDVNLIDEDVQYYLKQKCTYRVNKQSDGTWKVADFVGDIQVLDKTEY